METSSRWWDYYYVRYFVGSITGAVLFLGAIESNDKLWCQIELWFPAGEPGVTTIKILTGSVSTAVETLITLGSAGLAFCYLASAPVLLLHAVRRTLGSSVVNYSHIRCVIAALCAACFGLGVCLFSLGSGTSQSIESIPVPWWARLLPFFAIMLAQIVLLLSASEAEILKGYKELSKKRAEAADTAVEIMRTEVTKKTQNWRDKQEKIKRTTKNAATPSGREYIESYRHLREHGNAFTIVVMELVLAFAFSGAPSFTSLGVIIVAWILPATFAWFLGTFLESRLD